MKTFLSELASELYDRYGDDIGSLTLVFPSRRARLFFCDALARITTRPIWQPHFETLNELMERMAGIGCGEPIKLVTELYKVYARHHNEPFDSFYYWGEMLLADFDQIDKYEIDADQLFTNISDLRSMEDDFSYLTEEQAEIVRRFWQSFTRGGERSQEQQEFLKIWHSLRAIYHEYREALNLQGVAYEGMVHRRAAERILRNEIPDEMVSEGTHYIVAGFNALSRCEKRIFRWLQESGRADFYWDYDNYYVQNPDQEAGLFLRENRTALPAASPLDGADHFAQPKQITAVSIPSDSLQCKYVHTFLQNLLDQGFTPDKETAIVLTDETLLQPVLYSIPEGIPAVNVTMGYPLRQTTAYSFIERLIELHTRKKLKNGAVHFYHSDVIGILGHPYILEANGTVARDIISAIQRGQIVYVSPDRFQVSGLLEQLFRPSQNWEELSVYLRNVLSEVGKQSAPPEEMRQRREFFTLIIDSILQVENSLKDCQLEVTTPIFSSLVRKILQNIRIPYEGEPLSGIQVMGILETRNLDFENVLVLSVNDETFPGNRSASSSFVPHNLRLAYGLPTPQHHEGVYAYYFYRLIQRAHRIDLAYCSGSDNKRTGEPSRYIYQLDFESPHPMEKRSIPLHVNLSYQAPIEVRKESAILDRLNGYLDGGTRTLSPTSFYNYVECPLKFYFRSIAGLSPEESITEEIDLPMFGTILHHAMETLYTPLIDTPHPERRIKELIRSEEVNAAVAHAIQTKYLREETAREENFSGNMILVRDIVQKYIKRCILPYDGAQEDFVIHLIEKPCRTEFSFEHSGQPHTVNLGGQVDRLDLLTDGTLRVIDYKTGGVPDAFTSIEALFSPDSKERRPAALQTLLYSLVLNQEHRTDVQPALYYVRQMNKPDYSPLLLREKTAIHRFSDVSEEFTTQLRTKLSELFNPLTPFTQCNDARTCSFCDFREICRR